MSKTMLNSILGYELKLWSKQLTIYFYAAVMLVLGLAYILIAGDILQEQTPDPYGEVFINAPISIFSNVYAHLIVIFLFLLPIVYGVSIHRDFSSNFYKILYSYPVVKREYYLSKFLSSTIISIVISLFMGAGFIIGEFAPGLDSGFVGATDYMGYVNVYLIYIIPNIVIFGAIVFSTVAITRNIYAGFLVVVLIVVLRMIVRATLANLYYIEWAAVLDPYGSIANMYHTHDWTIDQKNSLLLPFTGYVIYNRLLWSAIAVAIFTWGYSRFALSQFAHSNNRSKKAHENLPIRNNNESHRLQGPPPVSMVFSRVQEWRNAWLIALIYLRSIIAKKSFIALLIGLGVLIYILLGQVNPDMTSSMRPFTQVLLKIPMLFFSFIITLLTFVYSGYLIQRVRASGMYQLIDATAVSNKTLIRSKLITMFLLQALFLSIILIVGIVIQVSHGHFQLDIGQYLFHLYGLTFVTLIIWVFAAFFIHSLLGNQYIGIFALLMIQIGLGGLSDLGIKQDVFKFNQAPLVDHSDLSGFTNLPAFFILKGYWLIFAILLSYLIYLIWQRGASQDLRSRWNVLRNRINRPFKIGFTCFFLTFSLLGSWIYQGTKAQPKLLSGISKKGYQKELVDTYENSNWHHPPRLSAIDLEMDLYPSKKTFKANAAYTYVQRSIIGTDTLWLSNINSEVTDFDLSIPYSIIERDSILDIAIIKLDQPMENGDSVKFTFKVSGKKNTLFNTNSEVANNGTFIMPSFPHIGLPAAPDDEQFSIDRTYVFEDFLTYEATVSTDLDQVAISPGELVNEWTENDRRYFKYINRSKVRNGFIYHSGAFDVLRDSIDDVNLEIYHHPSHDHNLRSMMDGMKATIRFCERHFAPYQFNQMRIVEFPLTYGRFAQSFANTISYSEWAGFLMNIDSTEEKRFDSPFRLTSHEMAHQWWGHQVVPANMPGSRFITEALAEYVSIRTLEEVHGEEKRDVLLSHERIGYFNGHNKAKEEQPLAEVPVEQAFVSYQKGSLALYGISGYIGEHHLHEALGKFLRAYRFVGPPYPVAMDLIEFIKSETPDSLKYLVTDYLEDVILYDNRIIDVQLNHANTDTDSAQSIYELDIDLIISKYRSGVNRKRIYVDSTGSTLSHILADGDEVNSLPLKDYINVSIYGGLDDDRLLLYQEMILFEQIQNSLNIQIDQEPMEVIIDDNQYLLDKNYDNNVHIIQ